MFTQKNYLSFSINSTITSLLFLIQCVVLNAQNPTRDFTIPVTDNALYFDGVKLPANNIPAGWESTGPEYDYEFGKKLVADGDCITAIDGYLFFAWYAGGKDNRYIQVSRFNPTTNQIKTFQLNWQHTGFRGNRNIGESHNTIAIGISPKNKTLHLLYDMHAYSADVTNNPGFYSNRIGNGTPIANRYFRYSYSIKDVTAISDDNWTQENVLEKAVDNNFVGNYTHNNLNGANNPSQFERLTYPRFFLNSDNDLFFQMRVGGNTNGALRFYKYNSNDKSWGNFRAFNVTNAKNNPAPNAPDYNWGLYGDIKFLNDKICIGFQRRKGLTDKYQYQDGMFFAVASNANATAWEDYEGNPIASPVVNAESIKIGNPERQLPSQGEGATTDEIVMTGPFDYTVTKRGDIHMIARVRDNHNNESGIVHYYKPISSGWNRELLGSSVQASNIYTSGNKVYIIGLNNQGRLRIDVSEGGSNSFSKIYEETTNDIRYRHGTVRIKEGKVLYLGIENNNNTDNKEPLHVTVIDLNLPDETPEDITGKWFNLRNGFTNRYLDYNNNSLVASGNNIGFEKQWRFVKSGDFYNIENRSSEQGAGVLRGVKTTNQVIRTGFSAPNTDSDKQWTLIKLFDGSYRFKIRTDDKYAQNNTSNTVTLTVSDETNRTKWFLEEASDEVTLDINEVNFNENDTKISIYPNPATTNFNILLNQSGSATIEIYNLTGKLVYQNNIQTNLLNINTESTLSKGLYMVKIATDTKRTFYKKLLIK